MDPVSQLIAAHPYYVLLPLAVIEGPIVSFVAGLLISQGYLELLPTFAILVLGDFIPDMFLYGVGRLPAFSSFSRRIAKKIGIGDEHFEKLRQVWITHTMKTMLLVKLAYGVSSTFLVSAGLVRVSWGKFVAAVLIVTVAVRGILTALGLFLGSYFRTVAGTLQVIEVVVAAAIVAAVAYYVVSRRSRARLLEETERPGCEGREKP